MRPVAASDEDPKDIDDQQAAESRRLLGEMDRLIERARMLLNQRAGTQRIEQPLPGTLGAVLYGNPSQPLILEQEWVSLLRSVAAKDQLALHALHERVQGPVHALAERIAGSHQIAEEITVAFLREVWRQADRYDARSGTVLAWIMNLARTAALAEHGGQRATVASNPDSRRKSAWRANSPLRLAANRFFPRKRRGQSQIGTKSRQEYR